MLRPTLSLGERVKKLKLKYKRLCGRTQMYNSLMKKVKPKGDSKYKNSFGRKAQKLRVNVGQNNSIWHITITFSLQDSNKEQPRIHSHKQVWGTAVELHAMTCLYQVAIKVLAYYTKAPNYRWNAYIPQSDITKFENPLHPANGERKGTTWIPCGTILP